MLNNLYRKVTLLISFLILVLGVGARANDLSIYQPALTGSAVMMMMLDTSGSMGDGNGYGTGCTYTAATSGRNPSPASYSGWCSVSSIIGDYGYLPSVATNSPNYATACSVANTSSSTTSHGVTTTTWTYNNSYSNTQDSNNGYSFQLAVPSATVNGQILPGFTLDYCPAPTVAIGQNCYATALSLSSGAPNATLAANAINGLTASTTHTSTSGISGTAAVGGGVGTYCLDRVSRLKLGMMLMLTSNSKLVQSAIMGVGHFSGSGSGNTASGTAGEILAPAVLLGPVNAYTGTPPTTCTGCSNQRYLVASAMASLTAWNGTPTANAYAEAAAYMLGTNTSGTDSGFSNSQTYNGKYSAVTSYSASGVQITSGSGSSAAYVSPIVAGVKSFVAGTTTTPLCGQGIYFLSDGEPNSSSVSTASALMKTALGGAGSSFSCPTAPSSSATTPLTSIAPTAAGILSSVNTNSGNNASGWECMGSLAQALNNPVVTTSPLSTALASTTANVVYPIKTAFVAFGTDFQGFVPGGTTAYPVPTSVVTTGNSSFYYDALNSCEWASRMGGTDLCSNNLPPSSTSSPTNPAGGYGNGGFYFATTPSLVVNSVTGFLQTLQSSTVPALTTGSPSIPIDDLNPTGFQPYGYVLGLSPNPANTSVMAWNGNMKKYNVSPGNSSVLAGVLTGTNLTLPIFQSTGALTDVNPSTGIVTPVTKELWNQTSKADGGLVTDTDLAGFLAAGTLDKIPPSLYSTAPFRSLFTDLDPTSGKDLMLNNESGSTVQLTQVPKSTSAITTGANLLKFFVGSSSVAPYNATLATSCPTAASTVVFGCPNVQIALMDYLGYTVPLNTALTTTTPMTALLHPYLGATIHSQPIQITYTGTLASDGKTVTDGLQSLLYGTMDGAIHLVDATVTTGGTEQMVFVPNEILRNPVAVQALVAGSSNLVTPLPSTAVAPQHTYIAPLPSQGVDGPWTSDPTYSVTPNGTGGAGIKASSMKVYGGLRMGGSSYYGLDISSCSTGGTCTPNFLFRVGPDTTNLSSAYSTMGQSWSKPVLANVRYNGVIIRVMIVGGGYDLCYENPQFSVNHAQPNTANNSWDPVYPGCDNIQTTATNGVKTAAGNSVYMIATNSTTVATPGQLIWQFTNSCTITNCSADSDMVDSVVSSISTLDRDGDGLIDHLYFGDLGGKIYRADVNNAFGTAAANFGVHVATLANLSTAAAAGDAPRFYEQPTLTFYTEGSKAFILVGIASGDRSNPLDVVPGGANGIGYGGEGLTTSQGLATARPANNVYGIIDTDFSQLNLITQKPTAPTYSAPYTPSNSTLLKNPQYGGASGGSYVANVPGQFYPGGGTYHGWYRSLSAVAGVEPTSPAVYNATNGQTTSGKTSGGKKAFTKQIAVNGTLAIPVYDPEGVSVPAPAACAPRVVGETDVEFFCLPYGACYDSVASDANYGKVIASEANTGAQSNPASVGAQPFNQVLGPGIRGLTLVSPTGGECPGLAISNNQSTLGGWGCNKQLTPIKWYEKLPNPARVN